MLWAQQERGLNTALPYGLRRVQANRTMTTEGVAALIPFKVQEVSDIGGMFYGINPLSHKPSSVTGKSCKIRMVLSLAYPAAVKAWA